MQSGFAGWLLCRLGLCPVLELLQYVGTQLPGCKALAGIVLALFQRNCGTIIIAFARLGIACCRLVTA